MMIMGLNNSFHRSMFAVLFEQAAIMEGEELKVVLEVLLFGFHWNLRLSDEEGTESYVAKSVFLDKGRDVFR